LLRWLRRFLAVGLVLVVLVAGYLGYVAVRRSRTVALPALTGPLPVGRQLTEWTEPRADPLAPHHTHRRISVWLWYPSVPAGPHDAVYAPGLWTATASQDLLSRALVRSLDHVRAHARADAAVVPGSRLPVLILQPGMGNNAVQQSIVAENLASNGYLVAVPTPTYSADVTVLAGHVVTATAAGQRITPAGTRVLVPDWAGDDRFTLDRLAALDHDPSSRFYHRLDLSRVGFAGHSFGGSSAIQACAHDARCDAAADVDGYVWGSAARTGISKPLLLLASDGSCVTGTCAAGSPEDRRGRDASRSLLRHSTSDRYVLEVTGSAHANFTDMAAWYMAAPARWTLRTMGVFGSIDATKALRIESACLQQFFDHELRGRAAPLLHGERTHFPALHAVRLPRSGR
jgi:dienelactone hydrolase